MLYFSTFYCKIELLEEKVEVMSTLLLKFVYE